MQYKVSTSTNMKCPLKARSNCNACKCWLVQSGHKELSIHRTTDLRCRVAGVGWGYAPPPPPPKCLSKKLWSNYRFQPHWLNNNKNNNKKQQAHVKYTYWLVTNIHRPAPSLLHTKTHTHVHSNSWTKAHIHTHAHRNSWTKSTHTHSCTQQQLNEGTHTHSCTREQLNESTHVYTLMYTGTAERKHTYTLMHTGTAEQKAHIHTQVHRNSWTKAGVHS